MKEQSLQFEEFNNLYQQGCTCYENCDWPQAIRFFEKAKLSLKNLSSLNAYVGRYILDMYRKMLHIYVTMLDYDHGIQIGEELMNLQEIEDDSQYNVYICMWLLGNSYMYKAFRDNDEKLLVYAEELFKTISIKEDHEIIHPILKEVHIDTQILNGIKKGCVRCYISFNLLDAIPISSNRTFKITYQGMTYTLMFYKTNMGENGKETRLQPHIQNDRCYCSSVYLELKHFLPPNNSVTENIIENGVEVYNQFLKLYRFNSGNYEVKNISKDEIFELKWGLKVEGKNIRFAPWSDKILGCFSEQTENLFFAPENIPGMQKESVENTDALYYKLLTCSKNALLARNYIQAVLDASLSLESFIYHHFHERLKFVKSQEELQKFLNGACPCEECELYLSHGDNYEHLPIINTPTTYQIIKYMNHLVSLEMSNRQLVKLVRSILIKRNEIVTGKTKEIQRKEALRAVNSLEEIITVALKTYKNKIG